MGGGGGGGGLTKMLESIAMGHHTLSIVEYTS